MLLVVIRFWKRQTMWEPGPLKEVMKEVGIETDRELLGGRVLIVKCQF